MSEPATKEDVIIGAMLNVIVACVLFVGLMLALGRAVETIKSTQPCRQVEVTK